MRIWPQWEDLLRMKTSLPLFLGISCLHMTLTLLPSLLHLHYSIKPSHQQISLTPFATRRTARPSKTLSLKGVVVVIVVQRSQRKMSSALTATRRGISSETAGRRVEVLREKVRRIGKESKKRRRQRQKQKMMRTWMQYGWLVWKRMYERGWLNLKMVILRSGMSRRVLESAGRMIFSAPKLTLTACLI